MRSFYLTLVLSAAVCASALAQITNYEAPGNLQARTDLGCLKIEALRNTYTAADLYQSIKACVKQDDLESAIYSSILANVYGRYDSMRVSDPSAHQAPAALRMQLQISLTEEQKKLFNTQVSATWNDPAKRVKICGRIREVGPPNYHPTYMIQHGMSAFTGSKGNGLVADFDSAAAWEKVLETSLHCPTP